MPVNPIARKGVALRGLLNRRLSAHAAIVKRDWGALQPLLLRRINLEIQGNLVPKLHTHIWPR
jgi:hypothetical protein